MFSLVPLGDLSRFRCSNVRNEVYLITEDECIKANGLVLAARSVTFEEMLQKSENIPAVEFSDDLAGLEDCLDLAYGGTIVIREDNFKSIYKFGKMFGICEMMEGVLSWIVNDVSYHKFWNIFLNLKSLHGDTLVFLDIMKKFLIADGDDFMEHTIDLCRGVDNKTILAVVDTISKIDDIRVLSVLENIADIVKENTQSLDVKTSSSDTNNHLQTVISSTVSYVDNYLKSNNCDDAFKSRCKQTLQNAAGVCTNLETLRTITKIVIDTSIQSSSSRISTVVSTKDLNWETVKQLTSPTTSYDVIRHFTEHAGTGFHPCVAVEMVCKWWSVQTDKKDIDMSFIKPFITIICNVSSEWYENLFADERYKGLKGPLDLPDPTTLSYMYYGFDNYYLTDNPRNSLFDCIRKGDGTPVRFSDLRCSNNMKKYRQFIPGFTYNDTTISPYGDAKCHWYIRTWYPYTFMSLITNSKEEVLHDINGAEHFHLCFVPGTDIL